MATTVLSNAADSGHCFKINTLNVSNYTTVDVSVTISYHTAAGLGGSSNPIIANANIPAGTTLTVIDKSTQYYIEENRSIGATATVADGVCVTVSYEDIY